VVEAVVGGYKQITDIVSYQPKNRRLKKSAQAFLAPSLLKV
jgi:hypothetical protein